MTDQEENIHAALNQLMAACGFIGKSGTEKLFIVLADAVEEVEDNWDEVEQGRKDGLCNDMNALLAQKIKGILKKS